MSRKLHFLFVSAPFGGIEVLVRNLCDAVRSDPDIEASWIMLEFDSPEWFTHLPPLTRSWMIKGFLLTDRRVSALERSGKRFDAAFFNHIVPPMFLRGFRRRVPSVLSLDVTHALLARYQDLYTGSPGRQEGLVSRGKAYFARELYRDAAAILPWSGLVRDSLHDDYGVPLEKMTVVPPGIDLERWSPRNGSCSASGPERPLRVLFVGAEYHRKGGDLLAGIASRQEFANCEFHFVCRDFPGTPPANAVVHREMRPNTPELIALYRASDIFVLPTRADFSPVAVCEAMATGLPVITSSIGALGEIVEDGRNGFLIPQDDPEALAARLKTLVMNPGLRHAMGACGRAMVGERFDLKKSVSAIIGHMKEAVARPDAWKYAKRKVYDVEEVPAGQYRPASI